jgi:mRNA interferase MazF
MNNIQAGDIFLVKFHPGYGNEFKKYRPAVIISSKITKIDPRFVLIAPFTTNTKTKQSKFEIIIDHESLEKKSLLLAWYIRTIDSDRLVRKLGTLSTQDKKKISKAIIELF